MKAEVVSIKLKVGQRTIELSAEEARSVYTELGKVFDREVPKPTYIPTTPIPRTNPYPYSPTPIWFDRENTFPKHWDLTPTCKDFPGSTCMNLSIG